MNNYLHRIAPWVSGLSPYQPGKPIEELERELALNKIVKLASNESPYGPSPNVTKALTAAINGLSRYPDGNGYLLKQALARQLNIASDQITLGNGSSDVLEMVARVFLTPAHDAVFSDYAFAMYPIIVQSVGAKAKTARAKNPDSSMPYGHDLVAIREQIGDNTRLVFIANPNNPTGTYLNSDSLFQFIAELPEHVMCVVDEAYFEYANYADVVDYPNCLQWLEKFPNLIVTRTFSKAFGLAGLRVGCAISSPQVTELLNRIRQPFNVSIPAMVAAEAALSDTVHMQKTLEANRMGLVQLIRGLEQRGFKVNPSVANFVCVDMRCDSESLFQKLLKEGVIIRPLASYAMPDYIRVTTGTEEENQVFFKALDRLYEHD